MIQETFTAHSELAAAIIGAVAAMGTGLFLALRAEARETRKQMYEGLKENATEITKIRTTLDEWRPMWDWFLGGRK